jgi:hypothetical protein
MRGGQPNTAQMHRAVPDGPQDGLVHATNHPLPATPGSGSERRRARRDGCYGDGVEREREGYYFTTWESERGSCSLSQVTKGIVLRRP